MSETQHVPDNICDILKKLKDEKIIVMFRSGNKEQVKVVAVEGDVLVATVDKKFIFINCDCICSVIADCIDVISKKFSLQYDNC
ncbi:MAG: hypothetical protein GX759_07485 [Thermoanaerobacterales bacterium]|nr:hypothetical protein [Thermoanaerobacterales bacterium]